jgi:CDP-diacylglycerol---serine O-phosphatidyltransferase
MVRQLHVADLFTLANAACGTAAIFCAMIFVGNQSLPHFFVAAALAPAALVFDVLDGRVARSRHTHSTLGRELDSLADVISFGVAPAALGFAAGLRGGWDWVALIFLVCCGVGRLARYNVTADVLSQASDSGKVPYFEGTPITLSVLLTGLLALAAWQGRIGDNLYGGIWTLGPWDLHPLALLYFVSGSLMISKNLRIPKP